MCGLGRGIAVDRPVEPGRGRAGARQFAALCRVRPRDRGRSSRGAGDRRGARRQRRQGLCRRGRTPVPRAGQDHRRRRKRPGCRRRACSPASPTRTASSPISAAAASSWCGSARHAVCRRRRGQIGAGHQPAARPASPRRTRREHQGVSPKRSSGRSPPASVLRAAAGRKLYLGRRRGARHRPAAYGAHAYPLHIIHQYTIAAARGRRLSRHHRPAVPQIARADHDDLAQAPRSGAARGIGPAQADRRRGTATRRLFRARVARRLCLWPHPGRGTGIRSADRRPIMAVGRRQSRFRLDGDRLQQWTAPLFRDLSEAVRRRHRAACWLSDLAWSEHPDYRARQAFTRSLTMPFAGEHPSRPRLRRDGAARPLWRPGRRPGEGARAPAARRAGDAGGAGARLGAAPRLHVVRRRASSCCPRSCSTAQAAALVLEVPAEQQPVCRRNGTAPPRCARPLARCAPRCCGSAQTRESPGPDPALAGYDVGRCRRSGKLDKADPVAPDGQREPAVLQGQRVLAENLAPPSGERAHRRLVIGGDRFQILGRGE